MISGFGVHSDVVARPEGFDDWGGVLALGFAKVAETCHPGFSRATRLTFRKTLKD